MYAVSDAFKAAVRESHTVITKAEVLRDGIRVAVIEPQGGSVSIDARRAVRRTCDVTVQAGQGDITYEPIISTYQQLASDYATYALTASSFSSYGSMGQVLGYTEVVEAADDLVPLEPYDTLTPYGNELKLYRGLTYVEGTPYTYASLSADYATYAAVASAVTNYGVLQRQTGTLATVEEYVPLGVFGITRVAVTTTANGVRLDVSGVDRSKRISDNRWTEPYAIAAGTNVGTALLALLQDRYADIQTKFTATDAATTAVTLGLDSANDPWMDAVKIAQAAGLQLYFDQDGVCVLEPIPDYSTSTAIESYQEGSEAMVMAANRELSREGVYNSVIVTAEGSGTSEPFRGEAIDDDPASPTYVYGPFGRVTLFASTPLINSAAAAQKFASTRLSTLKGRNESLSWTQIVDPSLDAGDVVSVTNAVSKLSKTIVIDRLTIPLDAAQPMDAVARTITDTTEGT